MKITDPIQFLGKYVSYLAFALFATGCAALTDINTEIYQQKTSESTQLVKVSRDSKTYSCNGVKQEDCPIYFYINNTKVGAYLANEQSDYHLEPGNYIFKVTNCQDYCSSYELDTVINGKPENEEFELSVDLKGKPFIIKQ